MDENDENWKANWYSFSFYYLNMMLLHYVERKDMGERTATNRIIDSCMFFRNFMMHIFLWCIVLCFDWILWTILFRLGPFLFQWDLLIRWILISNCMQMIDRLLCYCYRVLVRFTCLPCLAFGVIEHLDSKCLRNASEMHPHWVGQSSIIISSIKCMNK